MIPRIPTEIINMLANVPRERPIMTTDGVVYDGIRYRFAPEQTTRALSNNHHRMPHRFRLKGTAKIHVSIRCWDGNIDRIQVIDDDTGADFSMWSTNPAYTGGLSRWEHHQYQEMTRKRLGPGQMNLSQNDVEREIMATKADFLARFDERRPKMSLQESGIPTALVECEEHRQAILKEATGTPNPDPCHRAGSVDPQRAGDAGEETQYELFCDTVATSHGGDAGKFAGRVVAGQDREDEPKPPKQPARHKSGKAMPEAPPREEGFGTYSTADLTRPAEQADAEDEDHYENPTPDVEDDRDDDRRGRNLWPDAE